MQTTKQKTIDAIENLPDDAFFDDIMMQLAYLNRNVKPMSIEELNRCIDRSMEDSKNDRVISAEGLKEEIKTWGYRHKRTIIGWSKSKISIFGL